MTHLRYYFSYKYGLFMLRFRSNFYSLKAPWNTPLFSERNRFGVRVIPIWFNWRISIRKVEPDG